MTATAGEANDDQTANHGNSPSTPNSNANTAQNSNSKSALATKDRSCPFCGQAFTSSSLGRHLDLYIRPKNPKPADGVHDVDEIRKLRGGITRRQPRTGGRAGGGGSGSGSGSRIRGASNGREQSHSRQGSAGGVQSAQRADDDSPMRSLAHAEQDAPINFPGHAKDGPGTAFFPNKAHWQATGVINNLPPRASSRCPSPKAAAAAAAGAQAQRIQDMLRDSAGTRSQRPDHESSESMWKLQESAEMGRAAEMALREVLGSLAAAAKKMEPKLLFDDFDFFSLSFPGLCLAILPPPSTLFSANPFPSADSWTLDPPGLGQFTTMARLLNERRQQRDPVPDAVAFKHHAHLSGAWEHWNSMAEQERVVAWQLECLRSFTRSQERNSQLRSDLDRLEQHNRHLEAEYDRLSRCQLPLEFLTHPPNTIPISPAVMKEVKSSNSTSGAAAANYNAEDLITKWRSTIRASTRPSRLWQAAIPPQQGVYTESTRNNLRDDMLLNGSVWNIGGRLPRATTTTLPDTHREVSSISYETPPNPGVVVGANDDDDTPNHDADADGEAEDDNEEYHQYGEQTALTKRRKVDVSLHGTDGQRQDTGILNVNGKRPLGGRSSTRLLTETVPPR